MTGEQALQNGIIIIRAAKVHNLFGHWKYAQRRLVKYPLSVPKGSETVWQPYPLTIQDRNAVVTLFHCRYAQKLGHC